MRVLVSGASGLIGSALTSVLEQDGDTVVRLVRRPAAAPAELQWDPDGGHLDLTGEEPFDAAVHLAGAGIGDKRWTARHKERIRQSRVRGTTLLADALARTDRPPAVFVSASAIGYYGDRGDEELTEDSPPGQGFLSEVVQAWEAATSPAERAGIRTVHVRSGIVLSRKGGALGRMLPLFKLGLGGHLGHGHQWWSWVSLDDEVGVIRHGLTTESVTGPLNATAPEPVTNRDFTRTLASSLRRPAFLPVPRPALSVVMGRQLADEMLLASQRALPARALATGYTFSHPELDLALRWVLGTAGSGGQPEPNR